MKKLEPGENEKEVSRRVIDCLARKDIHCIVALVAADERIAKYRHPLPTNLRWRKTLMVVVCARRQGLVASLTRIVCIGARPDELIKRTEAAAQVNAELFAGTRTGVSSAELYNIAARTYAEMGFPGEQLLHHQGGACGYRTRDWVAHPKGAETVEANQAFAWNPSVTGSKVEETCIAFEHGVEIITASPDWPSMLVQANERDYSLPDVLSR